MILTFEIADIIYRGHQTTDWIVPLTRATKNTNVKSCWPPTIEVAVLKEQKTVTNDLDQLSSKRWILMARHSEFKTNQRFGDWKPASWPTADFGTKRLIQAILISKRSSSFQFHFGRRNMPEIHSLLFEGDDTQVHHHPHTSPIFMYIFFGIIQSAYSMK